MAKLTPNQAEIIKQLKKEFEVINTTIQPKSKSLIDVVGIKREDNEKNIFLEECKIETNLFARKVHYQVVEDAEKLRADLQELGFDVKYKDDGTCCSGFHIIVEKTKDELMWLSYRARSYVTKTHVGENKSIPTEYSISVGDAKADSIELMVENNIFKTHLKHYYDKYGVK
jgi:hypothetical protein